MGFLICIEEEPRFKVTRKILGAHGKHVKSIVEASGAKLRLRGKGSGFLEEPEHVESSDPLMLCVSAQDEESYLTAKSHVSELLEDVYRQYRAFCKMENQLVPEIGINIHEGPRP